MQLGRYPEVGQTFRVRVRVRAARSQRLLEFVGGLESSNNDNYFFRK